MECLCDFIHLLGCQLHIFLDESLDNAVLLAIFDSDSDRFIGIQLTVWRLLFVEQFVSISVPEIYIIRLFLNDFPIRTYARDNDVRSVAVASTPFTLIFALHQVVPHWRAINEASAHVYSVDAELHVGVILESSW